MSRLRERRRRVQLNVKQLIICIEKSVRGFSDGKDLTIKIACPNKNISDVTMRKVVWQQHRLSAYFLAA